jgi:peptide deformylase
MAILPIVLFPDPVLLRETEPVERVDDEIRALVEGLAQTMVHARGIGLAANQVGVSRRVCVVDLSAGATPGELRAFVNPRLVALEGAETAEEGCLSFPGITLDIERAERVTIESLDLAGQLRRETFEGLMARVLQHECEHLDGRTFLQNVSPLKRELIKKQIRKRIKAGSWVELATP